MFLYINILEINCMNPSLVEPGVKYFLNGTLKQCSINKVKYYNNIFNVVCFIIFILGMSLFLYVKYISHNNTEYKEQQRENDKNYMLDLVHKIQTEKRIQTGSKITDLPEFQSEYELTMKKFI